MSDIELSNEANALLDYMSELSEYYYCAGWLSNLEHMLWMALNGDKRATESAGVNEAEIQKLISLAEACHGWIFWDSQTGRENFLPIDKWKSFHENWIKENPRKY